MHRLSAGAVEAVVQLLDRGLARQVQLVFTAAVGPAQMELPARLTSRLAGGLIVGLEPRAGQPITVYSGPRRPAGLDGRSGRDSAGWPSTSAAAAGS